MTRDLKSMFKRQEKQFEDRIAKIDGRIEKRVAGLNAEKEALTEVLSSIKAKIAELGDAGA
uniref:Uncharacterized protein n=1 Tax=viral metagenome TaxID=1070528 RepID=A0A6H1ZRF2_9ZZZZ